MFWGNAAKLMSHCCQTSDRSMSWKVSSAEFQFLDHLRFFEMLSIATQRHLRWKLRNREAHGLQSILFVFQNCRALEVLLNRREKEQFVELQNKTRSRESSRAVGQHRR